MHKKKEACIHKHICNLRGVTGIRRKLRLPRLDVRCEWCAAKTDERAKQYKYYFISGFRPWERWWHLAKRQSWCYRPEVITLMCPGHLPTAPRSCFVLNLHAIFCLISFYFVESDWMQRHGNAWKDAGNASATSQLSLAMPNMTASHAPMNGCTMTTLSWLFQIQNA